MYYTGKYGEKIDKYNSLFVVLSAILLVGCAQPAAYREPITRFQQASTVIIEGARTEYGITNKRERDAVIDRLVIKKSRIDLQILNDPRMSLFTSDDLEARMAALDALAKHGLLLLALASSDAPTKAKDAANSLDDAIVGLSSSLGNVPSSQFKSTAEAFAAVAAEAAQLALEAKIRRALDNAITVSEKDVKALLRLLREDMRLLHERQRTILHGYRKLATDRYNEELKKPTPDLGKLQNAASDIKRAEDAWGGLSLLLGAGPGLDAMAQAHQQLVDYAKSSKTPQDLVELTEATDAFVSRAKVIADAINAIQNRKE